MTDLHPGDLVIAVPISECQLGHPDWHTNFAHPEMDQRTYLVTWVGLSNYWKRPVVAVAGRQGHFCAGCFAKQSPQDGRAIAISKRALVTA
ncbi:hypothetical protein ASE00_16370 [Sphingomonas sp. Root710]|uniref:hypothetical protein n=1 Tax=Sphingomonas sp. Root710 TaxID=1736594 RepID=UPI00070157DD|nr:hypothetical protein [Sphingomonas sp. Root710]KRB80621.1 hypothetical protein ASE00_16370 [Sphingomonas sp. Root710]